VGPIVYALFADAATAAAAEAELRDEHGRGGANVAQLHTRAPLDANILPEGATEFGRNVVIMMIAGAIFMATVGGIAGAMDLMLGMNIAMGVGLGFVTGALMGLVGAMQAGTRVPKPALRAVEPRLAEGCALLVVELRRREDAAQVIAAIERHGPVVVDSL
jgi:hypothetical protein